MYLNKGFRVNTAALRLYVHVYLDMLTFSNYDPALQVGPYICAITNRPKLTRAPRQKIGYS